MQSEFTSAKAAVRDLQIDYSSCKQQMKEATEEWKRAEERERAAHHDLETMQLEVDSLRKERNILSKVHMHICTYVHTWCTQL